MRADHAVTAAGARPDGGAPGTVCRLSPLDSAVRKRSFPPIVDDRSRVLVLGTLPGEESLRRQEYYAHPRNLFWPIVFALFEQPPATEYEARLDFVRRHGVALWDVCAAGARIASADATITAEEPNGIGELLAAYPAIRAVAFNGATAGRLHDRYFKRRPDRAYLALPSTSPAHARLRFEDKLSDWQQIRPLLNA